MASQPNSLQLDPETELRFLLSASEDTPRCTMTLRHSGNTDEFLAFKVKTTQPRRYLVRPNQGLIPPGASEKVAILLVEKDKDSLLQSYERLGQSALDHAKDKFLVQSCSVPESFSSGFMESKDKGTDNTELYESLNRMWSTVTGSGSATPVQNRKLHVRLQVKEPDTAGVTATARSASSGPPISATSRSIPSSGSSATELTATSSAQPMLKPHESSMANIENMTPQQLFSEISNLRKKYDELVSFSVNLTAERDILNNALEQTKRELNREMTTRASLENKGTGNGRASASGSGMDGSKAAKKGGSLLGTLFMMLVIGFAAFLGGVREAKLGRLDSLADTPVVGKHIKQHLLEPVPVFPAGGKED